MRSGCTMPKVSQPCCPSSPQLTRRAGSVACSSHSWHQTHQESSPHWSWKWNTMSVPPQSLQEFKLPVLKLICTCPYSHWAVKNSQLSLLWILAPLWAAGSSKGLSVFHALPVLWLFRSTSPPLLFSILHRGKHTVKGIFAHFGKPVRFLLYKIHWEMNGFFFWKTQSTEMKEIKRSHSYYCQDNIIHKTSKDDYFGSSSFVRSVDITQTTLFLKDKKCVLNFSIKIHLSCS